MLHVQTLPASKQSTQSCSCLEGTNCALSKKTEWSDWQNLKGWRELKGNESSEALVFYSENHGLPDEVDKVFLWLCDVVPGGEGVELADQLGQAVRRDGAQHLAALLPLLTHTNL